MFFLAPCLGGGLYGIVLLCAAIMGKAELRGGAAVTERRTVRQTYRRAEIHKGLVQETCVTPRRVGDRECGFQRTLRRILSDIDGIRRDACRDAQKIAVNGGVRLSVGKGRDGTCRVAPNAGQCEKGVEVVREVAAVLFDDHLRRALEIARAAVVAEPLPQLHEGIVVHGGEVMDARQCREETQVVGAYDGGTCLLEHDFRDPDVIRCRFVAPRQIACVGRGLVPCEQGAAEGGKDVCARPGLYIHRWFSFFFILLSICETGVKGNCFTNSRLCIIINL